MKTIGKRIFITGGAGFLGRNLIKHYYFDNEITVYSRDEAKHYYLKKQYPKIRCVIGDIRNYDLLKRASAGHDVGIFTASIKQIEAVDQNVEEAVRVIIDGTLNSRRVAEENGFETACFVSSDKSRAATTLYGAMKYVAGESFIVNAEQSDVRLSTAIYGNVTNSTGSVIPLIWDAIKNKYPLTLYSAEMTRFMISSNQAVQLIDTALTHTGYNVIPNLQSFLVKDLFDIYVEKFGLKYNLGTPRISEKIHEMMISAEESHRVTYNADDDYYYMHYKDISGTHSGFEFTSDTNVLSKNELNKYLKANDYYRV